MIRPDRSWVEPAYYLCAFVAAVTAFWIVGVQVTDLLLLRLGSSGNVPTLDYFRFCAAWAAVGPILVLLLSRAIRGIRRSSAGAALTRRGLFAFCAAAFIGALCLRRFVLHNAPLTDDESVYLFTARLLNSARLWVPSPPMKVFVDQNFMINDGRLYSQYFLGWPAILSIGTWLGYPHVINPALSALTVPALYSVLRRHVSDRWVVIGLGLFVATPMFVIGAATLLSHTACLFALAWSLAALHHTFDERRPALWNACFGLSASLAFFVRPQAAAPLLIPMLWSWSVHSYRHRDRRTSIAALAFLVPCVVMASAFLWVLKLQNGSPFLIGYQRYNQYIQENNYRFTTLDADFVTTVANFYFSGVPDAIHRTLWGMFRLNFDLFGWPTSFWFLADFRIWTRKEFGLYVAMVVSFLGFNLFQRDWGIDTFGPTHAYELGLPVLVLSVLAAANIPGDRRQPAARRRQIPAAVALIALIVTAWSVFVPVRLMAIFRMTAHLRKALDAPAAAGLHNAVVFAPWPFAPACEGVPNHYVIFRPVNDPDLTDDVLWVNHVDYEADAHLMRYFPKRVGYVMSWVNGCSVSLRRLDAFAPGELAAGRTLWR